MARAPVSVCIIVKNEEANLAKRLATVRPFVEEVVIVDTGSTDRTPHVARQCADKFEVYLAANDEEGRIIDFSKARQFSFSLATQPWIYWMDADDELVGGARLNVLTRHITMFRESHGDNVVLTHPYEYDQNEFGESTCTLMRERMVPNPGPFRWRYPVHELLCGPDGQHTFSVPTRELKLIHRRDPNRQSNDPRRNLRILLRWLPTAGEDAARCLLYLAREYGDHGEFDNAIAYHKKFLEVGTWDDERFFSMLRIAEHYTAKSEFDAAAEWAFKAVAIKESWAEPYFALCRIYYLKAHKTNDVHDWERSDRFGTIGLSLPPTQTTLFVSDAERVDIHRYLNLARYRRWDTEGALESVKSILERRPNDDGLQSNRRIYEKELARKRFNEDLNIIVDGDDAATRREAIRALADGKKLAAEVVPDADGVDMATAPVDRSAEQFLPFVRIWFKQLLLHDEVLAARALLNLVPWRLRGHGEVATMRAMLTPMLAHMDSENVYWAHYGSYGGSEPPVESVPLPLAIDANYYIQYPRWQWLLGKLGDAKGQTILDVGCYDGWLTNRLAQRGLEVYGIDASAQRISLANQKATEFGTGAKHCVVAKNALELPAGWPTQFDAITLFEVYEHVRDPVAMLKEQVVRLKPGGRLFVTTPNGSWLQGQTAWYHTAWNHQGIREHVRAPTEVELFDHMLAAGLIDVETAICPIVVPDDRKQFSVPGQASLCAVGVKPIGVTLDDEEMEILFPQRVLTSSAVNEAVERLKNAEVSRVEEHRAIDVVSDTERRMVGPAIDHQWWSIVFYVGHGVKPWNPTTLKDGGVAGSEIMVAEMAKRLAARGHRVTVYGHCVGWGTAGTFDGVTYCDVAAYKNIECDVLIVSRRPEAVDEKHNVKAKVRILWVHDVHCWDALTHERALRFDRIFALSAWHKRTILDRYPYVRPEQVWQTRNGIDVQRFRRADSMDRQPHRAIYTSSPDRGMEVALRIWPRVREKVPNAELHIFYGFDIWEASARSRGEQGQLELMDRLRRAVHTTEGVVYHGFVDQRALADEFAKSQVWIYPTWFSETSCISAMEAQAAGCRVVTSRIAALEETVRDGVLLDGDWLSQSYQDQVVEHVAQLMLAPSDGNLGHRVNSARDAFSLDTLVTEWEAHLRDTSEEVERDVVPPYRGSM